MPTSNVSDFFMAHSSARPGELKLDPCVTSGTCEPRSEVTEHSNSAQQTSTPQSAAVHDKITRRAVVILAILASLHVVYFAKAILLPLSFVLLLGCALRPPVMRLGRFGLPTWLTATVGAFGIVLILGMLVVPVVSQADSLGLRNPATLRGYASTLRERLSPLKDGVAEFQSAAAEIEEEINQDDNRVRQPEVVVEQQRPLHIALGTSTAFLGQLLIVVVGVFFVLLSGNAVVERTVALFPRISDQQRIVRLVHDLERGISAYLLTVTAINIGLGICVGVAMWAWGIPGAFLIGFFACVMNFVPIAGALLGVAVVAAVSILHYPGDHWGYWIGAPMTYLVLTSLEANIVTPALLGRSMSLNPLAVFLALVFWGWMWGVGGIVVAVPLLAALAIVAKHWDSTKPIVALISDGGM